MRQILKQTLYPCHKFLQKFWLSLTERTNDAMYAFVPLGLLFFFGYVGWFVMWQFVDIQAYENIQLRIIGSILGLPLILIRYWPSKLKPFIPVYWYLTLLFLMPFFFTFMLLKNNFSTVWQLNSMTALILLILVTDWASFAVLTILGIGIAWCVYALTTPGAHLPPNTLGAIVNYMAIVLFCGLFMYRKSMVQNEKLLTIKSIGASIAHELRTPLRTIDSAATGIKEYFPIFFKGYCLAKEKNLDVEPIDPIHYQALLTACDDIESETKSAFTFINMLLTNVSQTSAASTKIINRCSIEKCVDEALRRYPFDRDEAKLVRWCNHQDFQFMGDESLVIHVLFNLLKNALYQIKAANKGVIEIWTILGSKYNELHFKDTAKGIPSKTLPHIYDLFYSDTYHGTGIGLTFCKMVMQNLGGKIECRTEEDQYTEFVLYFPHNLNLSA